MIQIDRAEKQLLWQAFNSNMCGIVGAVAAGPVDSQLVVMARNLLRHRGPDHSGLWTNEAKNVCFGHTRLSIIDLSADANQPLTLRDGRFAITYNGEIYNYRELRNRLERGGASFTSDSDTEVLLASYAAWGEDCLEHISGMFAFAIWDAEARHLFCARDRVGEKPFYYATIDGTFVFASELKAIISWPGFRRTVCKPALVDFLTLGFVADPKTIWANCHKLDAGCCLTVNCPPAEIPRIVSTRRYWEWRPRPDFGVDDWTPEIQETLKRCASGMAVSDVPIGTLLSGGVDSSSVSAALCRTGSKLQAFTIGFPHDDYDETQWAQLVANSYGFPLNNRIVTAQDIEPVSEKLVYHYDEPFGDYSYLPTYYLCRSAREQVTVALSGDGSDEIFAGYRKYQRLGSLDRIKYLRPSIGRQLLRPLLRGIASARGRRRTLHQYVAPDEDGLANMLTLGFLPDELRKHSRSSFLEVVNNYRPSDLIASLLNQAQLKYDNPVDLMRFLDIKLTLTGDILVKVDRASMAVALEVRPVFLHRDMLDLSMRIPARALAGPHYSKQALKTAMRNWLPDPLLNRKKMGFAMPLSSWIRERNGLPESPVSELVSEWIDPAAMRCLYETHLQGGEDCTARLHSLYFLNHWANKWKPSG